MQKNRQTDKWRRRPYPTTAVGMDKYNKINTLDCNLHKCMMMVDYIFIIFEHVLVLSMCLLGMTTYQRSE